MEYKKLEKYIRERNYNHNIILLLMFLCWILLGAMAIIVVMTICTL